MKSRGLIVHRIVGLLRRIDGARYLPTLRELASDFEVCERTIRRDLEAFEAAGIRVPIWRRRDAS